MTEYHRGDDLAAPDPADMPFHWTPEQRMRASWHAHKVGAVGEYAPQTTEAWHALLAQAHRDADRKHEHITDLIGRQTELELEDPEVPW